MNDKNSNGNNVVRKFNGNWDPLVEICAKLESCNVAHSLHLLCSGLLRRNLSKQGKIIVYWFMRLAGRVATHDSTSLDEILFQRFDPLLRKFIQCLKEETKENKKQEITNPNEQTLLNMAEQAINDFLIGATSILECLDRSCQ